MIEMIPDSDGNLVLARASGELTTRDYEDVFIPAIRKALGASHKIRVVLHLDESFTGWELGAMWVDTKFGIRHRNEFEKIAVIGGPSWMEWATKLGGWFTEGEIRYFQPDEFPNASEWIRS